MRFLMQKNNGAETVCYQFVPVYQRIKAKITLCSKIFTEWLKLKRNSNKKISRVFDE